MFVSSLRNLLCNKCHCFHSNPFFTSTFSFKCHAAASLCDGFSMLNIWPFLFCLTCAGSHWTLDCDGVFWFKKFALMLCVDAFLPCAMWMK